MTLAMVERMGVGRATTGAVTIGITTGVNETVTTGITIVATTAITTIAIGKVII